MPDSPFKGKAVVLTGASSGIGQGLAVALASQGARLTLAARTLEPLEATAQACREAGGEAVAVPTDVSSQPACEHLMEAALERFGQIDALVNNAGISMWARFDAVEDLSMFDTMMRVNYLGAVYCTHFALPSLEASKGQIVAISSLTGKTGVPSRTGYAASKHAMQGFFDSLRIELRPKGVSVLVVSPGFVATGISSHALGPDGQPLNAPPRADSPDTMPLDTCVTLIVDAMGKRKRELIMTARAKYGQWLKLVAPGVVDAIAEKAVRDRVEREG